MFLGIDLGTSGLKTLAIDSSGRALASSARSYDIAAHGPMVGEQNPDDWQKAAVFTIESIIEKVGNEFKGISFSGQTHGIVCLDHQKNLLRPAIIWTDGRGQEIIPEIENTLGEGVFSSITKNRPFPGYGVVSLLWMKKYEPETVKKTAHVLAPKDYLRFLMTGEIGMDYSDASGICCLDMEKQSIASEMLEKLELNPEIFPDTLGYSADLAGEICARFAEMTGLKKGTPVFFGGVDCCMQSIANGITQPGEAMVNIGTSGQISTIMNQPSNDPHLRTTMFCHVIPEKWQLVGATLSAGLSLKWLRNNILLQHSYDDMNEMVKTVRPGSEGCRFLPFLNGERTPHMDPHAKAVFWGMSTRHDKSHLIRSVMEGVCFSLRECLEILESLGVSPTRIVTAGGGAKSSIWMQILADVLGIDVYVNQNHEEACLGACISAAVGTGLFKNYQDASEQVVSSQNVHYSPVAENHRLYHDIFEQYKQIYRSNAELFKVGSKMN
ncbi:MAG: xylulokinase [SAR324 cluster bacterium]|nr:xylulokinase [SAR324 cluster bacterium]